MNLAFNRINLARDYEFCVAARRDAYVCSFHRDDGFDAFLAGYRERMTTRLTSREWHYLHVWRGGEIVGQLEFRTSSSEPDSGYVNLIYVDAAGERTGPGRIAAPARCPHNAAGRLPAGSAVGQPPQPACAAFLSTLWVALSWAKPQACRDRFL